MINKRFMYKRINFIIFHPYTIFSMGNPKKNKKYEIQKFFFFYFPNYSILPKFPLNYITLVHI